MELELDLTSAPPTFKPAGAVLAASFSSPPALRRRRYSGARAQGVRFEKKVQEYLLARFPESYLPSPWLRFFSGGKWRWCQPDGLLFDLGRGIITIVEVKYQHTSDAWWQTKMLYAPVLREIFPAHLWTFEFCELVKWFDPATSFPERVVLANEVSMPSKSYKVHIWRP